MSKYLISDLTHHVDAYSLINARLIDALMTLIRRQFVFKIFLYTRTHLNLNQTLTIIGDNKNFI